MLSVLSHRFFHTTSAFRNVAVAVDKTLLSKLRKSTGYSLSHCKKALQIHDNNFEEADKWLAAQAQAEGWAKASKLAGRAASQGLLGIAVKQNSKHAAVVELNCETDFVARNAMFVELAQELTQTCLAAKSTSSLSGSDSPNIQKEIWNSEQVCQVVASDGKTLGDKVALAVGRLGENMILSRALKMSTKGEGVELYGYTHPAPATSAVVGGGSAGVLLGKFGAVVTVRRTKPLDPKVMKHLCLQIIGMSPECVGTEEELKQYAEETAAAAESQVEASAPTSGADAAAGAEADNAVGAEADNAAGAEDAAGADAENAMDKLPKDRFLLLQDWLEDDEFTVQEVLQEAGVEVLDFVRLRVGESSA